MRYNEYFNESTRNNIKMNDEKIEKLAARFLDGVTTCDFILPPGFKIHRIKECKYNISIIF